MKSIYRYLIEPKKDRYNNTIQLDSGEIIVNTEISNFQYISREAVVIEPPIGIDTPIRKGDTIIVHHNVFRRWYSIRGEEKNSSNFMEDGVFSIYHDQIFMYKRDGENWRGFDDFCFVLPVKNTDKYRTESEEERVGVLFILNEELKERGLKEGDVIGFTPASEYEFIVDGQLMYRMRASDICVHYKDRNVEIYNPDWASMS